MINIKRLFLVFTFFGCFFSSEDFNAQKINQFNENKQRTGIWIKYFPNNKVRYTGMFENGKEVGVFKFYDISSSKHPVIVKTYSKKNDAFFVNFYSVSGVLQSRGYYLGRKRIGHWIYYFDNGKLRSEEYYKDGKLNAHHVVIKDIFNWYMEGLGQQRIIVKLREKYPKVDPVQKMNPSTVMRWLQSDVVLGKWKEVKVYDAAVDEELFYDVQVIHKSRLYENVKPDRNWPLSGLMQCGVCGKGMSIQKSKNTLPVVRCSSKQRDRSCDRKTTFPYFIVHQYMFSEVQKRALRQYSQKTTSKEARIQLAKIEHELTKLHKQYEEDKLLRQESIDKGKSPRVYTLLMAETDDKIIELEQEKTNLKESIEQYDNYAISDSARDLVLTPRNFNLEMHKLNFRIVVGEDRLTTTGLNEPTPTMIYRGYSRKTLSYNYSLGGIEFEFPTKWIL